MGEEKNYEFKLRLAQAPRPTQDGSQCVLHDLYAISREAGSQDEYTVVPGRHKTYVIPGSELLIVLQGPSVAAKYKQALVNNAATQPVPVTGWDVVSLELLMDNNDISAHAAADADEWITVTMGLEYPVDFSV